MKNQQNQQNQHASAASGHGASAARAISESGQASHRAPNRSPGSASAPGGSSVGTVAGALAGPMGALTGPSSTTTKKEIIDRIAANTRQKRSTVKRTVQAFLDTVIDELSVGNRLELRDFGVFEIRERAARTAQNPKTLERVAVPARKTVKFKVGRLMKESVEEPERPVSSKTGKGARS